MNGFEGFQYSQFSTQVAVESQNTATQQFFQDESNRFHCAFPDCGKIFKFKSEVTRHMVIHNNKRPFVCHHQDCGKSFKRADALDAHVLTHQTELPYECTVPGCHQRFTTKAILKYHTLKHKNDCTFVCSFAGCGRTFFTKGQLKQHEKASTYHMNLTKQNVKQEENIRSSLSSPSTDATEFYGEFNTASPSFIHNIDWETKSEEAVEENVVIKAENDGEQENFESIVKYILKDNSVAEKKEHFIEDDDSIFSMSGNQWSQPIVMENDFMDENEFNLFHFLKEQQFGF